MGKLLTEPRLFSVHHDLQDVIVNVLATDQVERFLPKAETSRSASSPYLSTNAGPRVSIAKPKPHAAPLPVARSISAPPVQASSVPAIKIASAPPIQVEFALPVKAVSAPPVKAESAPPLKAVSAPPLKAVSTPPVKAVSAPPVKVESALPVKEVTAPLVKAVSATPVKAVPQPSPVKQPAPQLATPAKAPRTEPMNATFDRVTDQIQRMYVQRQRIGFWCRAALSMVLLSVLGFVCYYLISSSPQLELSFFL